jgi:ElaB/YqjD/DUF883 family membrane-anchored ribosome-binding protein
MSYFSYQEHLKAGSVPTLGMLAWYSVPESSEIAHKDFLFLIEKNNAPLKTPELPKAADVFRRACNNAKMLKIPTGIPGEFFNYTMRDSGYDDGFVFRSAVEERVDSKNHELGFRVIGQATFSRESVKTHYQIDVDHMDDAVSHFKKMQNSIDSYVDSKATMIPAIAVRESARRALENTLLGTRVRPGGGVYFINPEKLEKLEAIDAVINNVPNASFHILPLVDDSRQREMLKSSFEDESIEETKRLIDDITEVLKSGGSITAKKFSSLHDRYTSQRNKLAEYKDLLSDALETSSTALDVCNAQIMQLLDKATDYDTVDF